ncbi:response regulator [bacterium]|nr:response regulator [bacterium]MBP9810221.1 response regulator [bacterium]
MKLPILRLIAKSENDLVVARYRARQVSELAGLKPLDGTRLVTAVSEMVRNAVTFAGEARIEFAVCELDRKQCLEVVVSDNGPGFDVANVLQDSRGNGRGIACSRKLVEELTIVSAAESGTSVRILKAVPSSAVWITAAIVDDWIDFLKKNSPFSVVEDLEQQNKQLLDSLTEIEKYRSRLEERTEQLTQASKYKGEFLANMSHEIRTPMNAVIGMSNILGRTELNDQQKKYLRLITSAGNSLLDIINDILDFSKIEAGKLVIEIVQFDLFDLVETSVELLSSNAHAKDLALTPWIEPTLPPKLQGDPIRIRQLIVNLVNNAIKFTEKGDVIVRIRELERSETDITLRFEVIDSGIGLTNEQQQKLFQPFMQADGSTTRKYGGTGLGLSICKQLIDLMGGRIGVESIEGAGSTFWFELPLLIDVHADMSTSDEGKFEYSRALVVDDHPVMREVATCWLDFWKIPCDSANCASEALALVEKNQFDLFIVDYLMPGMNGLELVKRLRENASTRDARIILLTALHEEGLGEQAIAAGCDAFLTKPVRLNQLMDCLTAPKSGGQLVATARILPASTANITPQETLRFSTDFALNEQKAELSDYKTELNDQKTELSDQKAELNDRKSVLVVEDNPTNQIVARIELGNLGYEVTTANNGKEALKLLEGNDYSLVFMDCQMPIMDGYEAAKAIRHNEITTGKHISIIAMTANAMQGDKEKCLAAGMDDYITKPFNPKDLSAMVERWSKLPHVSSSAKVAVSASEIANEIANESASESANSSTANVIDYDGFKSRFNAKQAKMLLDAFIADTEKKLVELDTLVAEKQTDEVGKLAHSIKGAAAMIFAEQLAECAKEIEMSAKVGQSDNHEALSLELRNCFERLKVAAMEILSAAGQVGNDR